MDYSAKTVVFFGLLIGTTSIFASDNYFCNKLGGGTGDNFYAYQMCDFLSNQPMTPMRAYTRVDSDLQVPFELNIMKDRIVIERAGLALHGIPLAMEVKTSIDGGPVFEFTTLNYGFGEYRVAGQVRHALLTESDFESFLRAISEGQRMRVLWQEMRIPLPVTQTHQIEFDLSDAKRFIEHVQQDTFPF